LQKNSFDIRNNLKKADTKTNAFFIFFTYLISHLPQRLLVYQKTYFEKEAKTIKKIAKTRLHTYIHL